MFTSETFDAPRAFNGPGFRLEPLGPEHNQRDHAAWMSSIDHIRSTPGLGSWDGKWPAPMSLDDNLADLIRHRQEFDEREAFAYSILDGDDVIGCLYIDPIEGRAGETQVVSWVRASRAEMDSVVWTSVSEWLTSDWPLTGFTYAARG